MCGKFANDLAELIQPVKLIHFTQERNLEYGAEARQLLEELTQISGKTLCNL